MFVLLQRLCQVYVVPGSLFTHRLDQSHLIILPFQESIFK